MCADLPDESSEYAAEGSCAHKIREECLSLGLDPYDFVGTTISSEGFTFEVTEAWAEALTPGIDRIRDLGGDLYVEYRVKLDRWAKGQFGTLDAGIVRPDLIVINDLKFGMGVPVSPVWNEQLMIYALGFWDNVARHLTDAEDFIIAIDQPRAPGGGGEWKVSLDELRSFGRRVKRKAKEALSPGAPITPGEIQCQWCPAAQQNKCAAHAEFLFEMTSMKFDDLDDAESMGYDPEPAYPVSLERRSFIVKHAPMFRKWLDRLHADTLADALAGMPTPGLKAVTGRKGPRKWSDEGAAERILEKAIGEDAYEKKLKSPTQAEGDVPKKAWRTLQEFIDQSDGKPTLVSVDDEREAVTPMAAKFDNLDK